MTDKSKLPAKAHEHFRKASVLHGYVETEMGEACKHALETGRELLAAKSTVPHGRWEDECKRLFDGSASSARFYMAFAKNMEALPKRQQSGVLLVEGSIEGAARAAKAAAKPKPPKPRPDPAEPIDVDSEPATAAQVQEAVAIVAEEDAEDGEHAEETPATEVSTMSKIRTLAMGHQPPAAMAAFLRGLADELTP